MRTEYIYESLLILGLFLYLFNYFRGKATNRAIANKWAEAAQDVFSEQFSVVGRSDQVGINEEKNKEPFPLIDQEAAHIFKFYASGRANVKYCMTTLELQRRQDFLMMFGVGVFFGHKDKVCYEIPFHITNEAPPLCFAVFRKKMESDIMENYKDIKLMCKKYKVEGVTDKLTIVSDHAEMLAWFFDKQTKDFIRKYEKNIDMIQVSDRQTFFRT